MPYASRIAQTTSTIGNGDITLGSALTRFRPFSSAFNANQKRIGYCIENPTGTEWEEGEGTLISATVFRRDTVFASSAAGAKVVFSVGNKNIYCCHTGNMVGRKNVGIDIRDYDVDPTFTNDSTAGFQQAILDCYSTGGGIIHIASGHYAIGAAPSVSSAQLYIPNTRQSDPNRTIRFLGDVPPNYESQGLVVSPPTNNGVLLESTIIGGSGTSLLRGEAGNSGDSMVWNYTNVGFENMGFRTKSDTAANPMSALNLGYFSQIIELNRLKVDTNIAVKNSFDPTSVNSTGIVMPGVDNHAQFNTGTILITGYTNGIILNEHACAKAITVLGCVNAVVLADGNHGSIVDYLLVECCKNSIVSNGRHPLFIGCYSSEHNTDGNWFDFTRDLKMGTGTLGTRKIVMGQSTVVKSHVGVDDSDFSSDFTSANYKVLAGAGAN